MIGLERERERCDSPSTHQHPHTMFSGLGTPPPGKAQRTPRRAASRAASRAESVVLASGQTTPRQSPPPTSARHGQSLGVGLHHVSRALSGAGSVAGSAGARRVTRSVAGSEAEQREREHQLKLLVRDEHYSVVQSSALPQQVQHVINQAGPSPHAFQLEAWLDGCSPRATLVQTHTGMHCGPRSTRPRSSAISLRGTTATCGITTR